MNFFKQVDLDWMGKAKYFFGLSFLLLAAGLCLRGQLDDGGWGPEAEHGEGIVFAGTVDDAVLASLYARARLLAYVPYEEGFGLPPVEAMHYGTPVVASPIPGAGNAAFTVDPMDVDDIARALVAAAADGEVRTALAADGKARAGLLTWEATARAHVALWNRLS